MDFENLKKFVSEITDIVYAERILILIFIFIFSLLKTGLYFYQQKQESLPIDIVALNSALEESDNNSAQANETYIENQNSKLVQFNPSTVSLEELVSLGFSTKTANILINYRSKGGRFFKKEDVKKIYGISPEFYARIEPYISIESTDNFSKYPSSYDSKKPQVIDINLATIEQWKALPGIGDAFANKFVKMREGLGAFYSLDQIKETYGMADSTFQKMKPFLTISKGVLKKININDASPEQIRSHPYILKRQADDILKHRPIYGLDDFWELYTFKDKAKWKNIEPYLEF